VGTSGRFKRAPIVGGGGGLALDDAPWPNSSAALKPSTSSMVMPESGLARLFVMKSEARDRRPRDGGSGARRNSGRAKKRHSSVLKRCEARLRCGLRCSANTHQRSKSQVYGESLKHVELFFSDWLPVCQKNI
jgi:hypothetical protein